jgi:hypothetical protein
MYQAPGYKKTYSDGPPARAESAWLGGERGGPENRNGPRWEKENTVTNGGIRNEYEIYK